MPAFVTNESPDAIRDDLLAAHRQAWRHVASPGTWLTGAERVAVAAETRAARGCALCGERKAALSAFAIEGEHDRAAEAQTPLSVPLVDAAHRITTDASRLTRTWLRSLLDQGLAVESYVEALGVATLVISVDAFHHAMGLPLEPLPAPESGEPSRRRPNGVTTREAWVPMIDLRRADPAERRLLGGPGGRSAYVIRALSLVPAEVRAWSELASAQYLSTERMSRMDTARAIDRSQMELVAGRVSALNECFY